MNPRRGGGVGLFCYFASVKVVAALSTAFPPADACARRPRHEGGGHHRGHSLRQVHRGGRAGRAGLPRGGLRPTFQVVCAHTRPHALAVPHALTVSQGHPRPRTPGVRAGGAGLWGGRLAGRGSPGHAERPQVLASRSGAMPSCGACANAADAPGPSTVPGSGRSCSRTRRSSGDSRASRVCERVRNPTRSRERARSGHLPGDRDCHGQTLLARHSRGAARRPHAL